MSDRKREKEEKEKEEELPSNHRHTHWCGELAGPKRESGKMESRHVPRGPHTLVSEPLPCYTVACEPARVLSQKERYCRTWYKHRQTHKQVT